MSDEYFVWTLEQEHDRDAFFREELSDEAWRSLCVEQGLDLETTGVVEGPEMEPVPYGARWWPWPGWSPLIAVYALKNPSIKPSVGSSIRILCPWTWTAPSTGTRRAMVQTRW